MTGQPFLTGPLGADAAIVTEIAPGADLTDADGSGWTWVDITSDVRHADGTTTTIGRADNVGTTPAAQHSCTLNNPDGDYSPADPLGAHWPNIARNMPFRQRLTLNGIAFYTRFQGYLQSLVPGSDLSGKVSTVALTAAGMLARIAGRKRPLKSPWYRALAALSLAAWWPLEDGSSATAAVSAVDGQPPLAVTGSVTFGADGGTAGAAAVDFSGGGYLFAALPVTVAPPWRIVFAIKPGWTDGGFAAPINWTTTDGAQWQLALGDADAFDSTISYTVPGLTATVDAGSVPPLDGLWHSITIEARQNGSDIGLKMWVDDVRVINSSALTGGAATLTAVNSVTLDNPPAGLGYSTAMTITGLGIHTYASTPVTVHPAATGHTGETADDRLTRLAAEENIDLDLTGTTDVTMGPQGVATLLALLQEAEAADHGILYDGLGPGLGYVCRSSVYRESVAYTLDMSAEHVTAPATGFLDMQGVTNLVTAGRTGGSAATVERADGPSGTDLIGDEDTSATLNVDTDDVLPFHAGWLAALGTPAGQRIPQISPNVRRLSFAKLSALLAAGPRHRLNVSNPPTRELGPDLLDLLAEGWTENTTADHWALVLNTSPFAPYNVAVLDDADDRLAAGTSSTLHASLTSSATSFTVDVAAGKPLWTTAAGQFPLDIAIGGERITLSAISGASSPQTFTASARHVNGVVKAHSANDVVEVWFPATLAL